MLYSNMYSDLAGTTITKEQTWSLLCQTISGAVFPYGSPYTIKQTKNYTLNQIFTTTETDKYFSGANGSYKFVSAKRQSDSGITTISKETLILQK